MLSNDSCSEHALDELVDFLLTVAPNTSSVEWMTLLLESLSWRVELEWPEEVVNLLEFVTTGPDLVDDILNTSDSLVAQGSRDWCVVSECDSLLVNLSVSSLVDETTNIITGWVTVGDVWLDKSNHVDSGTVELNKHSVVELSQTEKLHDLLLLWWELVDTIE